MPLWRDDRDARFEPRGWEDVLGTLAGKLRAIIDEHGPDAVAFYISGQLLTEDYYAINKLAKGFLGTNNVDSNSRLCMSSAVAGYSGAFGFDGPPPAYADIALADCFLLLGTNTAACHPILWARIRDRQAEGAFVICADPRRTPTAQRLGPAPARAAGHRPRAAERAAARRRPRRAASTRRSSRATRAAGRRRARSRASGRPRAPPRSAASTPSSSSRPRTASPSAGAAMALWSMGANQSTVGTLKNRALINLCLASGQIGRPGSGPAVADRPAQRDGRARDRRPVAAAARLPQGRRRRRPRRDGARTGACRAGADLADSRGCPRSSSSRRSRAAG